MRRVLHVLAGLGSGGAESVIMNWYRNIDRSKVQFDFLIRSEENIYSDEISRLGGHVYVMPEFPKHYIANYIETDKFFKNNAVNYDAVHVHANALLYVNIFNIAKKYGIKKLVIHSHNSSTVSKLFMPIHLFNRLRIKRLANVYFACSDEAGKWAFGSNYKIINNGIDVERFKFLEVERKRIREELGIDKNTFVLCNVGRFVEVKNQEYTLKVFQEYNKINPNSELILVGTGPLFDKCKMLSTEMNLDKKIHFLGVRKDIPDILSASDLFVFPSVYEGLPLALVEAQANGLYCLASNLISDEVGLTDSIKFLSIYDGPDKWCEKIKSNSTDYRCNAYKTLQGDQYDIKNIANEMQEFYLS